MTIYLLAHGSVDPRHAADVSGIARRLSDEMREHVRACYLDLCPPDLAAVADRPGVVVPLLFSPGYHVKVDVGLAVEQAKVELAVADPPLLTSAAAWGRALLRQTQAAWSGREIVAVTAGTRDPEVLRQWEVTAASLAVPVVHASGPGARLEQLPLTSAAVALPLLVARGSFSDLIARQATARGLAVADLAGSSRALTVELARVVQRARKVA
jgi:sirohydrochlorin ferrochelatase